ncbi:ZinT/AdcA family metal-binding protein [Slackia exigua]|uniref:ZinT/AdcA family metal-binding protein n=1 Tax=Slackia exigua TaxID=84109 RepID=UPI002003698E|nr:ZinT/AdcA family metal-binding protein [Slackia exigua]MCK6139025.1 ZinT/AdcA family metal-binding protein [Slackia exigua]
MKALNKVCRATAAVGIALALAGCAGQAEKDQAEDMSQETMASQPVAMDEASAAKTTLAGWKGTWNDFSSYLDKDEVADAYDEAAKMNKTTAEDVKAELKEKRSCEFHGLKIEGDTVSFLDGFESEGGTEIAKATYECVDSKKVMHGGHELEWDVFKAKEADAKYPVLLMMPVHGEEELTHFHMRYGNDVDELMGKDDWYPTFVAPSSTIDQIKDEIKE